MDSKPFVSVVMPVRNEADFIEQSLGAVLCQDYPHDKLEIIVADGMSSDGTREVVSGLAAKHPNLPIQIVDNPRGIVPPGLNLAIASARGDVIVRVDGHCEIAPDYVSRCVDHLSEGGVDGVGGPIETVGFTQLSNTIALAMSSPFGVGNSAFRTVKDKQMLADSVPFPAYTRRAIELVGPYNEELVRNQDDEYNYRLRSAGCKILLAPDVRSRYYSRSSLRHLWRQYFQYGYWKVRVMQMHPRQMSLRQFAPPAFVLALFVSVLLAAFVPGGWLALALVAGSYCVANLLATAWTIHKRKAGFRDFVLLPLAFLTLHISYGLGFLVGLVKFRNRWADTRWPTSHAQRPTANT